MMLLTTGFATNLRTKDGKYYNISGAGRIFCNAVFGTEGQVQNLKYTATFSDFDQCGRAF